MRQNTPHSFPQSFNCVVLTKHRSYRGLSARSLVLFQCQPHTSYSSRPTIRIWNPWEGEKALSCPRCFYNRCGHGQWFPRSHSLIHGPRFVHQSLSVRIFWGVVWHLSYRCKYHLLSCSSACLYSSHCSDVYCGLVSGLCEPALITGHWSTTQMHVFLWSDP